MFESLGSASIVARGIRALQIRSNYFEANNFIDTRKSYAQVGFSDEKTGA